MCARLPGMFLRKPMRLIQLFELPFNRLLLVSN